MELFGIILSVPAAFVASLFYWFFLTEVVLRWAALSRLMWLVSAGVLIAFGIETVVLLTVGAVGTARLVGSWFYNIHFAVFVLGTPALANVLTLRRNPSRVARWYVVVPLCTAFALVLVLTQYGVSEALFGID